MKKCRNCRHGIAAQDDEMTPPYVVCALIPPTPVAIVEGGKMAIRWLRPSMVLNGFCGQFKLSVTKLLFRGSRA